MSSIPWHDVDVDTAAVQQGAWRMADREDVDRTVGEEVAYAPSGRP